jgi:polysaccharide export outer membrane protein
MKIFFLALFFASVFFPPPSISSSPQNKLNNFVGAKAYIIGPGDSFSFEVIGLPELNTIFTVGPDGTIYLPRLRSLYVEGLTVDELSYFISQQLRLYVKAPVVYLKPISFRPVRVYVGGEVSRPGFYTLTGSQNTTDIVLKDLTYQQQFSTLSTKTSSRTPSYANIQDFQENSSMIQGIPRLTTLYDAIRSAQGITPYSNIASIEVIRKQPLSLGGGKVRTKIDLTKMLQDNDDSANIRLYDSDIVRIGRLEQPSQEQLVLARKSNLSPSFIQVFVSGRIREPGTQILPQGSTLNQAIASAGGAKLLRGEVEFLRINSNGTTDRRIINLNSSVKSGEYANPILAMGDIIRIRDSIFSATVGILNEITGPAVGIYSVYSLFKP